MVGFFRKLFGGDPQAPAPSPPPADEPARETGLEPLAAIRPGMSAKALEKAMDEHWRAPAAHQGGNVDTLENVCGFKARLDIKGKVGKVEYDHRFKDTPIEGLKMGMTIEQAQAAIPRMQIHSTDVVNQPGVRYGIFITEDETHLVVKFTLKTINHIAFHGQNAKYEEEKAPSYPDPVEPEGGPFADPNLKLAVLSSLLDAKVIDLGEPEHLAAHVLGREVDLEEEGYDFLEPVYDYLVRYPLTPELLDRVDDIMLDGGNSIYRYAWYFWDGEDNAFDVADLTGIEQCRNLRKFYAIAMTESVDLRALAGLPKLELIDLGVPSTGHEALLDMPALQKADIGAALEEGIASALKVRGVEL